MRIKRKKHLAAALTIVAALIVANVLYVTLHKPSVQASVGNLQVFKGSAELVRSNKASTGWTGTPVELGDRIKVAAGSTVALILKDNTIIRLEGGSEAEVAELSYRGGKLKDAVVKLTKGRAWSRVQTLQKNANFEVETPTVTAAVRGTSFNVTYKDKISGVYVYHHTVEVKLKLGGTQSVVQTLLLQMHQQSLKADFDKGPVTAPPEYFDAWIKFNQAEDDALCRSLHDIPDCGSAGVAPVQPAAAPTPTPTPTPTVPVIKPKTTPKSGPVTTPPPVTDAVKSVTVNCPYEVQTDTYPCTATANWTSGKTSDVTTSSAWSLVPPAYGRITSTGRYYPGCPGDVIKAVYNGVSGTQRVTPVCIN